MALPASFILHLRAEGYHPRSDKHSNALAIAIVEDILAACPQLAARAAAGTIVYDLNFDLIFATATWNVDLVFGAPPPGSPTPPPGTPIRRAAPSTVEIAVELKAIMTEHHKAVKNRKRDMEAHHAHVHNYATNAVAGGVFLINAAAKFRSPLRNDISLHRDPHALVEHCLNELRAVTTRAGQAGSGIEAKAAIVVTANNIDLQAADFVTGPPAPKVGDPLHYDAFIQRICAEHSARFG